MYRVGKGSAGNGLQVGRDPSIDIAGIGDPNLTMIASKAGRKE